jgi:hypothetical protein
MAMLRQEPGTSLNFNFKTLTASHSAEPSPSLDSSYAPSIHGLTVWNLSSVALMYMNTSEVLVECICIKNTIF